MNSKIEQSSLNLLDRVIKIANTLPDYTNSSEKIKNVAGRMVLSNNRVLPVVDNSNNLVGIVTTLDILGALLRKVDFNKKISEIMVRQVMDCDPDEQINSVLQKMIFSKRGNIPIVKNGKLVGMVNERNFVRLVYSAKFDRKIEEIMTKKPFVVNNNMPIDDVLKSMVNTHYRRLPVVSNKKLVGIVTSMDVLKHFNNRNFVIKKSDNVVINISSKNIFSVRKDLDISDAIKLMTEKGVGSLPVVDSNNELQGIITERDIIENII